MTLFTQHVLQLPVKIQEDSVSGVFKHARDDCVPEISLSDRTGRSTWKSIHSPFTPPPDYYKAEAKETGGREEKGLSCPFGFDGCC